MVGTKYQASKGTYTPGKDDSAGLAAFIPEKTRRATE
jgi:hypothetical protein